MDISQFSISDLKSLLAEIPNEIKRREKSEKKRIRKELEVLAAQSGFSLKEIMDETTLDSSEKKRVVAAKYRHPQDSNLQWSGRGRKPHWVSDFIGNGGKMEDLAVK